MVDKINIFTADLLHMEIFWSFISIAAVVFTLFNICTKIMPQGQTFLFIFYYCLILYLIVE